VATNRYSAACANCSTRVDAGQGVLLRQGGTWLTYCQNCEPKPVAPPRGDHAGWHQGPMAAFDLETSGVEPETDFIVTAAVCGPDGARTWLIHPGDKEIPEEASGIHGITTQYAREHGRPALEVIEEIARCVAGHFAAGTPLVVYNASFDLTFLEAELRRHNLPSLASRVPYVGPVVDPYLIDKQQDRFRKGKRTLGVTAAFYGVPLDDAHTAEADAQASVQLARELGARYEQIGTLDLGELHRRQVDWAATQAASFQEYLDRTKPGHGEVINGRWPVMA
jgi:DNA polymerase-3 subunit epsilon